MQTHIQVGVGHHNFNVTKNKQSEYALQLGFRNASELARFVACSMKRAEYIEYLEENQLL